MPENPPLEARREHLAEFIRYRRENLRGDEKGEAQVFLDRLFTAFGHEGVFRSRGHPRGASDRARSQRYRLS